MINRQQKELELIFSKIDKVAKKGQDYIIDYYKLVDEFVMLGKYSDFKECLNLYYEYDAGSLDVGTVKKESWPQVRFSTNSSFQEQRQKLLKSKGVYQVSLDYYKEVPLTKAVIIDNNGSGAELRPVVENGSVSQINVLRSGTNYSASASVLITGGIVEATATAKIVSGRVVGVNITATGSGHNQTFKLGTITEIDEYEEDITTKLTKDLYQRLIKNKTTYLVVTKTGATQSATFSGWNLEYSYDKNLIKLYTQGVNYLLT